METGVKRTQLCEAINDGAMEAVRDIRAGLRVTRSSRRSLCGQFPGENAPWQHRDRHVLSHAVEAPQPVEYFELHTQLEQAIRFVAGETHGLLPVKLGSEFQDRIAIRDNGLSCLLVMLHQCPQGGLR